MTVTNTVDQRKPETDLAWLAALVASSLDAIVSNTLDGAVMSWNPAAAKLFGYLEQEMIGQSIRRLIPGDRQNEEDRILARIAAGECIERYVTERRHRDGSQIAVSVSVSPVRDAAGKIARASTIMRGVADIDDEKRTRDALIESELRMRLAQDAAHSGVWEWRLAGNPQ